MADQESTRPYTDEVALTRIKAAQLILCELEWHFNTPNADIYILAALYNTKDYLNLLQSHVEKRLTDSAA